MDSSLSSSFNKSAASKAATDIDNISEESGWTAYFDDFLSSQRDENNSCSYNTSTFGGTSLVSNAASFVERKVINNHPLSSMGGLPKFPKELNFKNTRIKKISYDDSLEDTASSPVNSPKVGSLKQMDINQREGDDNEIESSLGKGSGSQHHLEAQRDEMVFEGKNDDFTSLKKRGLCLIPMSKLLNYVG